MLSQTFSRTDTRTILKFKSFYIYLPMKMEETKCSEMSAYKIQTLGNYLEENIQHSEHGESLKSRIFHILKDLEENTHNKTQTPQLCLKALY